MRNLPTQIDSASQLGTCIEGNKWTYCVATEGSDAALHKAAEQHISEVAGDKVGHDHGEDQREDSEEDSARHHWDHHCSPLGCKEMKRGNLLNLLSFFFFFG